MHGKSQKYISKKLTKRLAALACLLCFAAVIGLSGTVLDSPTQLASTHQGCDHSHTPAPAPRHNHESADDNCLICALLHSAANLLKTLGMAFLGAPLMLPILFSAISLLFAAAYFYWSPIELRSRINS